MTETIRKRTRQRRLARPRGSAPLRELLILESRARDIGMAARKLAEDIDCLATGLAVAGSTIAQNAAPEPRGDWRWNKQEAPTASAPGAG
jgi:hypothetical protein